MYTNQRPFFRDIDRLFGIRGAGPHPATGPPPCARVLPPPARRRHAPALQQKEESGRRQSQRIEPAQARLSPESTRAPQALRLPAALMAYQPSFGRLGTPRRRNVTVDFQHKPINVSADTIGDIVQVQAAYRAGTTEDEEKGGLPAREQRSRNPLSFKRRATGVNMDLSDDGLRALVRAAPRRPPPTTCPVPARPRCKGCYSDFQSLRIYMLKLLMDPVETINLLMHARHPDWRISLSTRRCPAAVCAPTDRMRSVGEERGMGRDGVDLRGRAFLRLSMMCLSSPQLIRRVCGLPRGTGNQGQEEAADRPPEDRCGCPRLQFGTPATPAAR